MNFWSKAPLWEKYHFVKGSKFFFLSQFVELWFEEEMFSWQQLNENVEMVEIFQKCTILSYVINLPWPEEVKESSIYLALSNCGHKFYNKDFWGLSGWRSFLFELSLEWVDFKIKKVVQNFWAIVFSLSITRTRCQQKRQFLKSIFVQTFYYCNSKILFSSTSGPDRVFTG